MRLLLAVGIKLSKMTYAIEIPAELLKRIYWLKRAGMIKDIKSFVIASVELKLEGDDGKFLSKI